MKQFIAILTIALGLTAVAHAQNHTLPRTQRPTGPQGQVLPAGQAWVSSLPTFELHSIAISNNVTTDFSLLVPITNEASGSRASLVAIPQPVVGGIGGSQANTTPFMRTFTYKSDNVYYPNQAPCTGTHYYSLHAQWSPFDNTTQSFPLNGQIFNCVGNYVGDFVLHFHYVSQEFDDIETGGALTDQFQDSNGAGNEYNEP